jgi:hypothetical protein
MILGVLVCRNGGLADSAQETGFKPGQTLHGAISNSQTRRYNITSLNSSSIYELLVSGVSPGAWPVTARLEATLDLPSGKKIEKVLHPGDPDFYCMVQPESTGPAALVLNLTGASAPVRYQVLIQRLPVQPGDFTAFGRLPASSWRDAHPMRLGHTMFSSADEIEYLDNKQEGKDGLDWYTFTFRGPKPKLVMFDIDVLDRDVPLNLQLFKAVPQQPEPSFRSTRRGRTLRKSSMTCKPRSTAS